MKKEQYFEIKDSPKLKTSEIFKKLKEKVDAWSYWDDKELDKNFPPPKKETVRYFEKTVEPQNLGKSADQVDPDGSKGITIREYALMQLQYFEETGEHLDIKGWTICSGSHLPSGWVAIGGWYPGTRKVGFDWHYPDCEHPSGGARLAISPSTLTPSSLTAPSLTLLSQIYEDEETGMTAEIENGKFTIRPSKGGRWVDGAFHFKNSTKETVIKVAESLIRLANLL